MDEQFWVELDLVSECRVTWSDRGAHSTLDEVERGNSANRTASAASVVGSRFRVPEGWLELYHGGNSDGHYAMGALLLDAEDPARILGRSPEPILVATEEYERSGFYNNTVFSCGVVPLDHRSKRIRMYYGAADCRMAAADFDVEAIIASLAPC